MCVLGLEIGILPVHWHIRENQIRVPHLYIVKYFH